MKNDDALDITDLEAIDLCFQVYYQLMDWGASGRDIDSYMHWLITGEKGGPTPLSMSAEYKNICLSLIGPNGFTVYKMLLARRKA